MKLMTRWKELCLIVVFVAIFASIVTEPEAIQGDSEPANLPTPVPVTREYLKFSFEGLCSHGTCTHNVSWWIFKLDGRFEPPIFVASELKGEKAIRSVSRKVTRAEFERMVDVAMKLGLTEWIEAQSVLPHYNAFFEVRTSFPLRLSSQEMTIQEFEATGHGILLWLDTEPTFRELKKELAPVFHRCE